MRVLARANLTLQGQQIVAFQEVDLIDTPEVRACVDQQLLVPQAPDGTYPDLGPLSSPRPLLRGTGCCGGR